MRLSQHFVGISRKRRAGLLRGTLKGLPNLGKTKCSPKKAVKVVVYKVMLQSFGFKIMDALICQ
jgi:hypothetical protein